jgi:hypothetical protein
MRFDLYGRTQSEPKQGFCFDCIDARERNQPRRLLQEDFEQVLNRPIETTGLLGTWHSDTLMSGQTVLGFSRNRRKGGAAENLPVALQTDAVAYKL